MLGQRGGQAVNDFKGRDFSGEVVLWAVRWYCRYGTSYRDLETMMAERGVRVDHSTFYRWVQKYALEMERRMRWQWRRPMLDSWRVDETYIKVRGKWTYLYRAVDKLGNTVDFYLSAACNVKAAKGFLVWVQGGGTRLFRTHLGVFDVFPLAPLGYGLDVDTELPAQRRVRSLRSLYENSDGVRSCGAAVKKLSHRASL